MFVEFVKSLAPKFFKQKLEEKKADAVEQNQQRKTTQQEMPDKKKITAENANLKKERNVQ